MNIKVKRTSKPTTAADTRKEILRVQEALDLQIRRSRDIAEAAQSIATRATTHARNMSHALSSFTRLVDKIARWSGKIALVLILSLGIAQAEERKSDRRDRRERNWIIDRQTSYQVQGVPTSRIIVGKREIDIYRNGLMFERGNVVGVKK